MNKTLLYASLVAALATARGIAEEYEALTGERVLGELDLDLKPQLIVDPVSSIEYREGMSQPDVDGLVKLEGVEKIRAEALGTGNDIDRYFANTLRSRYFVESAATGPWSVDDHQAFQISSNVANARMRLAMAGGDVNERRSRGWPAYEMADGGSTQLWIQGKELPDAEALPGSLYVNGTLKWKGATAAEAERLFRDRWRRFRADYNHPQPEGVDFSPVRP